MRLLQYILNTNGAYIDTGIKNVDYCKTELKLQGDRTSNQRIFGFHYNTYHVCWFNNQWHYGSDGSDATDHSINTLSSKVTDICEIIYNDEDNKVNINGEKFGNKLDVVSNSNNRTIQVFKEHASSELYYGKLYYFKITNKQTNEVIIDLVPAISDDEQVGMYDKVSKKFFTSANNHKFVAGPELKLLNNLRTIYKDKQDNLLPENIREDVTIFGVTGIIKEGTLDTSDATATADDILENKIAYVDGNRLVGTIKNNGLLNITPTNEEQVISSGYTSGGIVKAVDVTKLQEYQTCLGIAELILNGSYVVDDLYIFYNGSMTDLINQNDGTLYGTYSQEESSIIFNGGYARTGNLSKSKGTWEIYCKVNEDFSPANSSVWYSCSCIFGCELSFVNQDFGIIIDSNGYYGIGYEDHTISSTDIKANDGKFHHLVLITEDTKLMLYIDGNLKKEISYSLTGDIPTNYGIFYNNSSTNTIVKGDFELFRYYTRSLSVEEIKNNYIDCVGEEI